MRIAIAAAVTCLSMLGSVFAADVQASIRKPLAIPAQKLGPALRTLAKEREFQIIYLSDSVEALSTSGAVGQYTIDEALKKLLSGSGLAFQYVDAKTVSIVRAGSETPPSAGLSAAGNIHLAQLETAASQDTQERTSNDTGGTQNSGGRTLDSSEVKDDTRTIQEVIVTAQKRSERLQDVPLAVTAVGQDEIRALGAKTFEDIARTVPGLTLAKGRSAVPVIRGVASGTGAATVGYYVDDTPVQVRPGYLGNVALELYDLERVEVLRGPQGTLYGGSAMGGTIRFITPQPSLSGTTGMASAEVSGTEQGDPNYDVGAAFGTPLIDGVLGFRGSAYFREAGGYIDRVDRTTGAVIASNGNTARTAQAQAALLWQPTSALSVKPSFFYQAQENAEMSFYSSELPSLQQKNVIAEPGYDRIYLPSVYVSYDFGGVALTSVTSAFIRNEKQVFDYSTLVPEILTGTSIIPGFTNYLSVASRSNTQRNFSQEIRLTSQGGGRTEWIVGAFYARQRQVLEMPLYEPQFAALVQSLFGLTVPQVFGVDMLPGDLSIYANQANTEKQLAAFGEVTHELVDGLKLTGGVRFSRSELEYEQDQSGPLNGGSTPFTGRQRATPVTPKVALSYTVNPDMLLYVSAAKGFRVGGVNIPAPAVTCAPDLALATGGLAPRDTYDQDGLWAYEVGLKSMFLDRRLIANMSVYRVNWSDVQQLVALPGCGWAYTANLGDARSQGAELELAAVPLQGLRLTATASYIDAELTSTVLGARHPVTGVQAVFGLPGDRIPGSSEWTGALSAEYRFALTPNLTTYARGDFQYTGSYARSSPSGRVGYDAAIHAGESYEYSSVRVGGLWQDWDVSLFVNNLSDARPVIGADDGLTPRSKTVLQSTLRPRTIGVSVERRF